MIKKNFITLFAAVLFFVLIESPLSANANELQDPQIEELNSYLPELIEEVNNSISNGDIRNTASVVTKNGGILTLGVEDNSKKDMSNMFSTLAKATNKTYTAFIGYDKVGFNFSHKVDGTYQINSGKVNNVTHVVTQTGWAYQKDYKSDVQVIDPSVKKVVTSGSFNAFQYGKQYVAYLDVTIYGSGNYKITRATIK